MSVSVRRPPLRVEGGAESVIREKRFKSNTNLLTDSVRNFPLIATLELLLKHDREKHGSRFIKTAKH